MSHSALYDYGLRGSADSDSPPSTANSNSAADNDAAANRSLCTSGHPTLRWCESIAGF